MARLSCIFLLGIVVVGVNSAILPGTFGGDGAGENPLMKLMFLRKMFGEGGDGMGPEMGEDKPLLKMMMLKNLLGGGGGDDGGFDGPGPIGRALMARNVPSPLMRAMILRKVHREYHDQEDSSDMFRGLLLHRVLGKQMGEKLISEIQRRKEEARVYTFQTTLFCDCAMEYIDDNGKMAGFLIDLVNEVCSEAGKQCEIMYDSSSNCYTHHAGEHSKIGPGLLGKSYDACLGWMQTDEREHSVKFTSAFWNDGNEAYFYVKADNPKGFDPENIEGKVIGFVDGWVSDKSCLQKHYGHGHVDQTVKPASEYIGDRDQLFASLEDETLDAIFIIGAYAQQADAQGFTRIGDVVRCGTGLYHAMTRKDSKLPGWFDETLDQMKESGKYYSVCSQAKKNHGAKGDIKCVIPEI